MNYRLIGKLTGMALLCLAALMLLPLAAALCFGESPLPFLLSAGLTALFGLALYAIPQQSKTLYARDGFAAVSLAWIAVGLLGALPFCISGDIPRYLDALFESLSGFTTTGATILADIEGLSRGCMFWRLFSQWIGGMGVLVFMMAVMPMNGEHSMHIMHAEFPGPTVGKLVPRLRDTARVLYMIYILMTALETLLLLLGGMSFYDALLHAFATAGTGGFSTESESLAAFDSLYLEMVVSIFALLFSTNFNLFFLLLVGRGRSVWKNEELRVYFGVVFFATVTIAWNIVRLYGSFGTALRHAFFNTAMVITTSAFNTVDYTAWPEYSKLLLVLLMMSGACAGSTCGGFKLSRLIMLVKAGRVELQRMAHPRAVLRVEIDGKRIDTATVRAVLVYFFFYVGIILLTTLLLSIGGRDIATNLSAAVACVSNIGPGMGLIGPSGNYTVFSDAGRLLLCAVMLLGRLELYPLLVALHPSVWRR